MISPEQREALERIRAAIEAADVLGPWNDDDMPEVEGDDWRASEFVVVTCWTNMRDGDSRLTRMGAPDLLAHHRDGLLHAALHDQWDDA